MRRLTPLLILALLVGAGLAVSVAPNPLDSFQGAGEFQLWVNGAVVEPTNDTATVTITIGPGDTEPSAVRATLGYDADHLVFDQCRTLDRYVACTETSPGVLLFEAVTESAWTSSTDLVAVDFVTRDVTESMTLDLAIDQALDQSTAELSGRANDANVAPLGRGDVNCSASTNIADAMIIAQYAALTRSGAEGCPVVDVAKDIDLRAADFNNDGNVSTIDALLIAQCAANLVNDYCEG